MGTGYSLLFVQSFSSSSTYKVLKLCSIFYCTKSVDGYRSRGWPKRRWMDCIKNDIAWLAGERGENNMF